MRSAETAKLAMRQKACNLHTIIIIPSCCNKPACVVYNSFFYIIEHLFCSDSFQPFFSANTLNASFSCGREVALQLSCFFPLGETRLAFSASAEAGESPDCGVGFRPVSLGRWELKMFFAMILMIVVGAAVVDVIGVAAAAVVVAVVVVVALRS